MCSSTSVSKTEYPEATPEERAMMNMATEAMMPSYLDKSGYDVSSTTSKIEDNPEWKTYQDQINREQKTRKDAQKELDKLISEKKMGGRQDYSREQQLRNQIAQSDNKINQIQDKQNKLAKDWKPETHYQVRQKDSVEVEAARRNAVDKYGEMSDADLMKKDSTYRKAKKKFEGDQIKADKQKRELVDTFMTKAQKFLEGDFSINAEQEALIQKNLAPQRAALKEMFNNVRAGMDRQEETIMEGDSSLRREASIAEGNLIDSFNKTFDAYEKRIHETDLSVGAALDAIGSQIIRTGGALEKSLETTIATNRALMKMGIEDYTGAVTKQMNEVAASMGRETTDPEYENEIKGAVARKVEEGSLNLARMEVEGKLRITERTGSGLEDVYRQKAALASDTGGKLEDATMQRGANIAAAKENTGQRMMAITERTATERSNLARERTNVAQQEGAATMNMEEAATNLRFQVGAGMAPQQIGVGMNVAQYQDAVAQQSIANAYNATMTPYNMAAGMRAERMAQPTTTTTQRQSPLGSIFDVGTGIANAWAGFI